MPFAKMYANQRQPSHFLATLVCEVGEETDSQRVHFLTLMFEITPPSPLLVPYTNTCLCCSNCKV